MSGGGGSISTDVEGEGGPVAMFVVCVASSMCKVCNVMCVSSCGEISKKQQDTILY